MALNVTKALHMIKDNFYENFLLNSPLHLLQI